MPIEKLTAPSGKQFVINTRGDGDLSTQTKRAVDQMTLAGEKILQEGLTDGTHPLRRVSGFGFIAEWTVDVWGDSTQGAVRETGTTARVPISNDIPLTPGVWMPIGEANFSGKIVTDTIIINREESAHEEAPTDSEPILETADKGSRR